MYHLTAFLRRASTRTVARFVSLHTPFLPEHTRSSIVKVLDAYEHQLLDTSLSLFSLNQNSIHPPLIRHLPALLTRHLPDILPNFPQAKRHFVQTLFKRERTLNILQCSIIRQCRVICQCSMNMVYSLRVSASEGM